MSYIVPYGFGMDEFVEKKSRFIGRVWRCESEQEAKEHIEQLKKELPDASHHAFAYSIKSTNTIRFNDAGEPQGTAGMPILEVFRREGVEDFLCTVTRYFGGTLLGAGGLTRAYARGAKIALDAAGKAELQSAVTLSLTIGYSLLERAKLIIEAHDGEIAQTDYGADVSLSLTMMKERAAGFSNEIRELTSGQVTPALSEERLIPIRISPVK